MNAKKAAPASSRPSRGCRLEAGAAFTRREFIVQGSAAAVAGLAAARAAEKSTLRAGAFSFILLGDLHFDRPEHHDMAWVRKDKPNDVSQIENYCRITRDITPKLLARVRDTVAELNRDPATRVAFVLQAGDLVEGLCGSEELAARQNAEALAALREANVGVPWLFTKGNHDITGPGAPAAFARVFHPFLAEQARALASDAEPVRTARFTTSAGNAQFAFFDAYEAAASLEWFEAVAARRTAEHLFVVVHPPVVPYGARATWHVFSAEKERARREKFLELLARQRALVLGGHIHRFNALAREARGGCFAQLAISSILSAENVTPKTVLSGVGDYAPDQIRVEPNFSPDTEAARRAVYEAERPFVKAFEYADLPGYAVVTVDGGRVTATMHAGVSRDAWRTVELSALARG